ncbi:O-antigen ligase family protein [Ralstonia solanacearum]|uniref:O-antigen ligase family protein n=1 Tax=Ralstonia solanacearum TaxID=305 RepID=UPI000695C99C|nr:O-antigen ligase family protein [Ralstonia solanacearum]MDB0542242.1 O-antigen ligase family protein [Ralstonia solanacearum]MDB0552486.1 O-antigen ligase family protein [Ralstonia solanacearum]MDB0557206.1 O-antigen ligase family protein [Ralstonia solanacearum]
MTLIVFVALIAAFAVALRRSPGRALLDVYLPVLLLIPSTFHATISTSPNFNQLAVLAIVLVALPRCLRVWRPSVCDAAIVALVMAVATSEYINAGYKEAQNLTFVMLTSAAMPYFAARWLIPAERLDVAAARRIVLLLAGVALVNIWEFRFGVNLFHALPGRLFPGQGEGWVTTFRYGVARTAGPFSHAILAGIGLVVAFRLQRWLEAGGHWEPRFRALPWLPLGKARALTLVLACGVGMTLARGPWLGALAGALMVSVSRARRPRHMLAWIGFALAAGGIAVWLGLRAYLDVQPGQAMTMSQESALYRKELMDRYVDIVLQHLALGWGRNTWPKVPGMPSIDNYYLLLSLMHGVVSTALLLFLMVWCAARLLRRGLADVEAGTGGSDHALSFAFLGILVAIFVSLGTVYLGESMMPLFYFVLGWAEGHLQTPAAAAAPLREHASQPPFRAVIA